MNQSDKEIGLIEVILDRLEKHRLPRLLSIKEKLEEGNLIGEFDVEFLERTMNDVRDVLPIIDHHPKYQPLMMKVIELYKGITGTALDMEQKS